MMRLRLSSMLTLLCKICILCSCYGFGLQAAEQEVLSSHSSDAHTFDALLLSISRGDSGMLNTIALDLLLAPLGRSDHHDPQLIVHKQLDIARAIQRLDPPQQKNVINSLELRYQEFKHLAATDTSTDSIDHALLFLPAPTAITDLHNSGAAFFDHGDIHSYLRLRHQLTHNSKTQTTLVVTRVVTRAVTRLQAAEHLLGNDFHPYDPAALSASVTTVNTLHSGTQVQWNTHAGYLSASDPWGNCLWQRPLGKNYSIIYGQTHAVLKNQNGIHLINSAGHSRALPHIPKAQLLGVSNFHIWFALSNTVSNTVYGLDLHTLSLDTLIIINLPQAPICAPLDDGKHTLWMTAQDLVYCDKQTVLSRYRHLLKIDSRYTLTHNGDDAFIQQKNINSDASLFRIHRMQGSPYSTDPSALCRRYAFDAALAFCDTDTNNNDSTKPIEHFDDFMLAPDLWIRAHADLFNNQALTVEQNVRLHHRIHRSYYPQHIDSALFTTFDNQRLLLPMGANDVFGHAMEHSISVKALLNWKKPSREKLHISTGNHDDGSIIIRARDNDNLLWQQHLRGGLPQPSISQGIKGDTLVILAGLNDCYILNFHSGQVYIHRQIPARLSDSKYIYHLGKQRLACIGPAGIRNQIFISDLRDNKIHQNIFHSTASIVWAVVYKNQILVSDGRQCRRYPDDIEVALPTEIITASAVICNAGSIRAHDSTLWHALSP